MGKQDNINYLSWLTLKSIKGVGNYLFKRLIDRFDSPEKVFQASFENLSLIKGISPKIISEIIQHKIPSKFYKELDIIKKNGFQIITMACSDYPDVLKHLPDPPPLLYVYGKLDPDSIKISIVGSRNATSYGIKTSRKLSMSLVQNEITIVSGMARGVDSSAHKGAIEGGGKTIAVLGSGLLKIYPPENKKLFHQIAENGAVVSEFSINEDPLPKNFPIRNRIISGLSMGTVVVEAAKKSGSLITARMAAEQGREVFAVPGYIQSFKSTGTHSLIKQGAKLVENANDILEEFPYDMKTLFDNCDKGHVKKVFEDQKLNKDELKVYNVLEVYPIHIDDIIKKLSVDAGKLSGILLNLEIRGLVNQTPGKFFAVSEEDRE